MQSSWVTLVRILPPLCVRCVSPVSWAQIRWGGLGWAGPWLWIMTRDGCRNDWEEPQSSECGERDFMARVPGCTWLSITVSYTERALCRSVRLSVLFRAPWESAELHSLCWHTGCVTTSNPVIVGDEYQRKGGREERGSKRKQRNEDLLWCKEAEEETDYPDSTWIIRTREKLR